MNLKIIFLVAIISEMATAGIRVRKKKVFGQNYPKKSAQDFPEQFGQRFESEREPEMKVSHCEYL